MTEMLTRTVNTIKRRTVPVASFSLSGEKKSNIMICQLSMRTQKLHYIVYEQSVFDRCSAFDEMPVVAELTLTGSKIHFIQEPGCYSEAYADLNPKVVELVRHGSSLDVNVIPA